MLIVWSPASLSEVQVSGLGGWWRKTPKRKKGSRDVAVALNSIQFTANAEVQWITGCAQMIYLTRNRNTENKTYTAF